MQSTVSVQCSLSKPSNRDDNHVVLDLVVVVVVVVVHPRVKKVENSEIRVSEMK
jgi:hypothetical protein